MSGRKVVKLDVLDDSCTRAEADQLVLRGAFFRAMVETSRGRAEQMVERVPGARLLTDAAPEVIVAERSSPLLGDRVTVAMRWSVEVPDSFTPPAAETTDALRHEGG